ncbi:hypothetical protein NDU88_004553 [Pleurodeles waltl]|uniref:Uncharacterized protein n=1 Tax=Pleurodeles waltl TaxID=8319 RepID=A0AAV7WW06_PLEWA|nr:hypothetical protein NDU88_004553 [Pleurodeles waltl]
MATSLRPIPMMCKHVQVDVDQVLSVICHSLPVLPLGDHKLEIDLQALRSHPVILPLLIALLFNQRVPRSGRAAVCFRCRFPATKSTRGSCLPRGARRPRTGALKLTHRPRSGRLVVPGSASATPAVPISAHRVQMVCDPAGTQQPPPVVRRTRSGRSHVFLFFRQGRGERGRRLSRARSGGLCTCRLFCSCTAQGSWASSSPV